VFALSLTCLQFIMPPRGRTHIALCITLLALPVLSCSHDATGPDSSAVVPKEPRFAGQFVAGGAHTCKLAADQSAYCWGANADGQSGSGVFSFSVPRPVPVSARSQLHLRARGRQYGVLLGLERSRRTRRQHDANAGGAYASRTRATFCEPCGRGRHHVRVDAIG
jgi:hypothetical protein